MLRKAVPKEPIELAFKPGDHLRIKRRFYYHHGVYIGDGKVVHYAPPPGKAIGDGIGWRQILGANSKINIIHITELKAFERDEDVKASVVPYNRTHSYPPLKAVARAKSRLGENGYNLWGNNCDHFASWCKLSGYDSRRINLWDSVKKSATIGVGAGKVAHQWAGIQPDAGAGTLTAAAKHWLLIRYLTGIYAEFAAYATALYFNLSDKKVKYPFGKSFRHAVQINRRGVPRIPQPAQDKEIIFAYEGGFWSRSSKNDWLVTERALIHPSRSLYIDFHDVAAITAKLGGIIVTDLTGAEHRLPAKYISANSVALFLTAAVSGTPIERRDARRGLLARLKDSLRH